MAAMGYLFVLAIGLIVSADISARLGYSRLLGVVSVFLALTIIMIGAGIAAMVSS